MLELLISLGAKPSDHHFRSGLTEGDFQKAAVCLRAFPHITNQTWNELRAIIHAEISNCELNDLLSLPDEKKLAAQTRFTECYLLLNLISAQPVQSFLEQPDGCCAKFIADCRVLCGADTIAITPQLLEQFKKLAIPECSTVSSPRLQQTMLMWACIFGHQKIVEMLVTAGLPQEYINAQDCFGRTALMYALLYGNVNCALTLMHHRRYHPSGTPMLVTSTGKPVIAHGDGTLTVEDGTPVLAQDVHNLISDHCGQGVQLLDSKQRSALWFALYAGLADDTIIVGEGTKGREISTIDYSTEFGAILAFNLLLSRKVAFSRFSHVTAQALKTAAGLECPQVLLMLARYMGRDIVKLFS